MCGARNSGSVGKFWPNLRASTFAWWSVSHIAVRAIWAANSSISIP